MFRGFTIALIALALFACDENKLRSSGDKGGNGNGTGKPGTIDPLALSGPCGPTGTPSTPDQKVSRPAAPSYTFVGELCPNGVGSMSVLFIVDFSQSMQFPADLADRFGPGNDPETAGTCARLEAAKAVITNIQTRLTEGDAVDVSVVPFSSEVVTESKVDSTPLADFSTNLTPKYFCGTDSLTNYSAGFTEAKNILAKSSAEHKVVYFITDGKPYIKKLDADGNPIDREDGLGHQVDGPKAQQLGRDAISAMRGSVPSINFYSLFLGNKVEDPAEAVSYLNEISGQENVRVATEASQLANEIVKFQLPGLAIDPQSVKAKIDGKDLPIKEVVRSQKSGNIWEVKSQQFKPKGVSQVITIEGMTIRGRPASMGVTITTEQ